MVKAASHPYFAGEPMVLAHRGASGYAPEHTLTALRLALEQGADAIEADVHLSRDGHPVLHHSGELSENTNGSGRLAEFSLSQLREFDAGHQWTADGGASYPFRGAGERIATLAEALEAFPDARFNLDIKTRRAALPARRLIDSFGAGDRVLLASWYSWQSAPALRGYPGPCSISMDQAVPFLLLHWLRLGRLWSPRVDALQLPEQHWGIRVVTRRFIERAHQLGLRVHVWTVDDEADIQRLLDWGVDGIITKKPDLALGVRAQLLDR